MQIFKNDAKQCINIAQILIELLRIINYDQDHFFLLVISIRWNMKSKNGIRLIRRNLIVSIIAFLLFCTCATLSSHAMNHFFLWLQEMLERALMKRVMREKERERERKKGRKKSKCEIDSLQQKFHNIIS